MVKKGSPTKEEVEEFLRIFKSCDWRGEIHQRKDTANDDTLAKLGFLPKHRAQECQELHYTDYCSGPDPDHDGDPTKLWWVFGRLIEGHEIYIKIRVYKDGNGRDRAKCMSFHEAKWAMVYPFKKRST